jgi:hypothetical protein
MNRLQICLPAEVLAMLRNIAADERRTPKEQIEFFVIQAVRERGRRDRCPQQGRSYWSPQELPIRA